MSAEIQMTQKAQGPRNREERRREAKRQKKQLKIIKEYIRKHPEALKIEMDEEAIKAAGITDKDKVIIGGEFNEIIDNNNSETNNAEENVQDELVSEFVEKKEEK